MENKIKLLILDVDGVLTDGRIIFDSNGTETKFFQVLDGLGIILAKKVGIETAIITGRSSPIIRKRCSELGITKIYENAQDKLTALNDIKIKLNISDEEIAYMGDDLLDICVMKKIGYAIAPSNAVQEVKAIANLITNKAGGYGAVREAIEHILKAQGTWNKAIENYT
jgi:3-deoxy-D-manno-octulosonate 8-phosphate phosphatase (KDO 8-P phosphatase)